MASSVACVCGHDHTWYWCTAFLGRGKGNCGCKVFRSLDGTRIQDVNGVRRVESDTSSNARPDTDANGGNWPDRTR